MTSGAHDPDPIPPRDAVRIRSERSRTVAWIALGAALLAAGLTVFQVPYPATVALMGLPAFIAVLAWACYLRPLVELREDEVVFVNVARTVLVPFSRIEAFDLRLGLTVRTKDGPGYGAWALPSSGRRAVRDGLRKVRVEPHVPDEITEITDAFARWEQDPRSPRRTAAEDRVTSRLTLLPPLLLLIGAAWAVWGLRVAANL